MNDKPLRLEFPYMPPQVLRGNGRPAHWSQRHRAVKDLREATWLRLLEVGGKRETPFPKATLEYHVFWCGKPIDQDGLCQGAKPILDEIVSADGGGYLIDDSPEYLTILPVLYTRVPHRSDVRLVVTLTSAA